MIQIMEKLSTYERIVNYMNRMNIWEEMLYFLLENNIRSADQFSDESFVTDLIAKLPEEKLVIGHRITSYNVCYTKLLRAGVAPR